MTALGELLGDSAEIVAVRQKVSRLLELQTGSGRLPPILILGETGSGKGAVARAIHRAGPRASGPFVDVNCAAIPETLLESELFGHERGAFTDARQARAGLFQAAHRGTIFLDEIGLLPEGLQGKLLKVIEERAVRRLGSTRNEPVDVAILAATAEDLAAATPARRFREDLYHRLAVVTLRLPPLRERGRDIVMLAEHFLARACAEYRLPSKSIVADARQALTAYPWPGNVRELANVMERVALLSEATVVTASLLGLPDAAPVETAATTPSDASLEDRVRDHLADVLRRTNWNISRAAAMLGIARNTLRARIEKYGLRPDSPSARRSPARAPSPPAARPTAAPATPLRWEPRRLTLLRAAVDVPPALESQVFASRAVEALVDKVRSFGGRVEELSPTAILATFGLEPIEDAPVRAGHAAMAMRKAATRDRHGEGERVTLRIGIHVGQFLVGRAGETAEIDLDAKRQAWTVLETLLATTPPDTITVSADAAPFLERRFDLAAPGSDDESTPPVYRLAERDAGGHVFRRQMSGFVGRDKDLEVLVSRLAAAQTGRAQIVGIVGEPGIGKSRLVYEFRESVRASDITYREGRCLSYGTGVPYLPLLDMLRQYFQISEADTSDSVAEKVHAALDAVQMPSEEWAPYLLELLGVRKGVDRLASLSPEAVKARTLEALRQLVLRLSQGSIIYVVEDLHWIDKTSEECIASIVEALAGSPVLFVATYRPGYRPPWMDKSYATQLALQPLSHEDSRSVVESVLQGREVPEAIVRLILERAEGNPFFLEELTRTVREQDDLRPSVAVPNTVEEVLLARIDRLPPEPKRLLQTASVLGREVSMRLLGAIWEGSSAVEPYLRELMRLEFLFERTRASEPVLVFKHALTQQVAYESVLPARRQALHARAGRALEVLYEDRPDEAVDRLAYHYAHAEEAPKAIEYLTRVAGKATRSHAHTEAVGALREALAHVERLPADERLRRRVDLVVRLASSLIPLGYIEEVRQLLRSHEASLEALDDPPLGGHFYFLLGRAESFLGEHEPAARSVARAIEEARRSGDEATMGKAYCLLSVEDALAGDASHGIERARHAVELLARAGEPSWLGLAHWITGLNHARLGEFEPALAAQGRARALGEEIGDARLETLAAWGTGNVHAAMGDSEEGIAACRRGADRAPDPLNAAIARGWLGYAYVEHGDAARAIPLLEQSTRQLGQFRFLQFHGWFTVFLADALRLKGDLGPAEELARRGHAVMAEAKFVYGIGWAERVLGRIAHARGDLAQAERDFQAARDGFEASRGRYDVALTLLDVAALAVTRGDLAAAASHLREARALFETLGLPRYVARIDARAAELGLSL